MTDDRVATRITDRRPAELAMQEWFVRERCEPPVRRRALRRRRPTPPPRPACSTRSPAADTVLVCPSNPVISIGPILAVPGIRDALVARRDRVVGVSPIIAGRPVKGPADRLMGPLGIDVSCVGVAREYREFCGTLVIDAGDAARAGEIEALGVRAVVADTLMTDARVAAALAARHARRRRLTVARVQPLTLIPVHGIPEVRPGRRARAADRRRRRRAGHSAARRRLPRRHPEDRVEGRGPARAARSRRPRRAPGAGRVASRCASCAAGAT